MALTVTAGTPATATQYNALIPRYYEQGSDQALTTSAASSNTFATSNLTVAAGEFWVCQLFLDYAVSVAANNLVVDWDAPAGTAVMGRIFQAGAGAGATGSPLAAAEAGFGARVAAAAVSYGGGTSTTNRGGAFQTFTLAGGISGGSINCTLATSAGTGTVYAGSFIVMHRVS